MDQEHKAEQLEAIRVARAKAAELQKRYLWVSQRRRNRRTAQGMMPRRGK